MGDFIDCPVTGTKLVYFLISLSTSIPVESARLIYLVNRPESLLVAGRTFFPSFTFNDRKHSGRAIHFVHF